MLGAVVCCLHVKSTIVFLGDVVGLMFRGCRKFKRGSTGVPVSDTRYDNMNKTLKTKEKHVATARVTERVTPSIHSQNELIDYFLVVGRDLRESGRIN